MRRRAEVQHLCPERRLFDVAAGHPHRPEEVGIPFNELRDTHHVRSGLAHGDLKVLGKLSDTVTTKKACIRKKKYIYIYNMYLYILVYIYTVITVGLRENRNSCFPQFS